MKLPRTYSRLLLALILFASIGPWAPILFGQTQIEPAASRPLPLGWEITIALLVAGAVGTAIYFCLRAWRSSNLFDRQYRFPKMENAALRFGANKSGGFMATIVYRDSDEIARR
jgi:hypothetical protein